MGDAYGLTKATAGRVSSPFKKPPRFAALRDANRALAAANVLDVELSNPDGLCIHFVGPGTDGWYDNSFPDKTIIGWSAPDLLEVYRKRSTDYRNRRKTGK